MSNASLNTFETATLRIAPMPIIPQIYFLTVKGESENLNNPPVKLVNTGKVENGLIVIEVQQTEGAAIGSAPYTARIDVSQKEGSTGILVVGANKKEELKWSETPNANLTEFSGFQRLGLRSVPAHPIGGEVVTLCLKIDAQGNVNGSAKLSNANGPSSCPSEFHVIGSIRYSSILLNPNVIELTGYPEIHMPPHSGVGPVLLPDFKAEILMYQASSIEPFQEDTINYSYKCNGTWHRRNQRIDVVSDAC